MLDLELLIGPTMAATDVVSYEEMKKHLRLSNDSLREQIEDAIHDAVAVLHGPDGVLNRTVLPCTWVRYLKEFPRCGEIQLPYPPLIRVTGIWYEDLDGSSPSPVLAPAGYIVRNPEGGSGVATIEKLETVEWPTTLAHPRAIGVIYQAGYPDFGAAGAPALIRRLVKILAAHFMENPEATINDRRQSMVSRKVEYGVDYIVNQLRVPVAMDNWD